MQLPVTSGDTVAPAESHERPVGELYHSGMNTGDGASDATVAEVGKWSAVPRVFPCVAAVAAYV